jgi:TolB protein
MDGWVVDIDNQGSPSQPRPLVVGFGEDMGPTWSPDGKWLAYHSHRGPVPYPLYDSPEHTDDIWLRSATDTSGAEIRLTTFGWEASPPDWAPDGRRLVFDSWQKGGTPGVAQPWIVSIDPGTGRPSSVQRLPLPPGFQGSHFTAWSPKGSEIALVERIDTRRQALWVVKEDGSSPRKLTEYECYTYGGVTWSPDGRDLFYGGLAGSRVQIFRISGSGGAPRQITDDSLNVMHPAISPDGHWLAATRILWRKQLQRIRLP